MSMVNADWSIDRSTGNVRYIGDAHDGASPSYATVIEFHRWLQDYADDAVSSGDDELDITDDTPSARSTDNIIELINGFNIDQTSAEHLYDGSIKQASGDDIWAGLVVVGAVPDGTVLLVVSNNTFVDDSADPYWGATSSNEALNGDSTQNILMRTLIKVRTSGSDVDGKKLRVQAQEWGDTYAEFTINSAGEGNNIAAIFTAQDLNNQSTTGAVSGSAIANDNEGYIGLDIDANSTNEYYYSKWDLNAEEMNMLYEYSKYIKRRGTAETCYGMSGDLFRGITHQLDVDGGSGDFDPVEPITWTGGTGQLLAIDNETAPTMIWFQLLTGVPPTDNQTITGSTSSASCLADLTTGSLVTRTVKPHFVGESTGAALIGNYGVGVDPADVTASDQFFDLSNAQVIPPNNVQFTVDGLISGEDRVLVAPRTGSVINFSQLTLQTSLTGGSETAVVVTASIPSDTPSTGTIRIQNDDGNYRRVTFTSWTGSTFTIPSTDFSSSTPGDPNRTATAPRDVFISYIDELASGASASYTAVYSSNRDLFVRVRDGGGTPIKTFEISSQFTSSPVTVTAIRTSDA